MLFHTLEGELRRGLTNRCIRRSCEEFNQNFFFEAIAEKARSRVQEVWRFEDVVVSVFCLFTEFDVLLGYGRIG